MKISQKRLKPFFSYFGAKWRLSPRYSFPKYNTIVEPFAGSACYSLCHYTKNIILVEKDPTICKLWRFLIKASSVDILKLPLIKPRQLVEDLDTYEEGKLLISFWLARGETRPRKQPGSWMNKYSNRFKGSFWGEEARQKIANQVDLIKHWKIIEGDFSNSPNQKATWFIDPPYQVEGKGYVYGSKGINYEDLSKFCLSRKGQIIVCENKGADWLPFIEFAQCKGKIKNSTEVIYET